MNSSKLINSERFHLISRMAIYLLSIALVVALCIAIAFQSYASAVVMVMVIVVTLAVMSTAHFVSLTLLYVVLLVMAHFLKRTVFLFGDQWPQSQYLVLAMPYVVLLHLLVRTFREDDLRKDDTIGIVFLLFIGMLLVSTWLNVRSGLMATVLATGYAIFPMMAFFVYRKAAKTPRFIDKFCLTVVILGAVMGTYGMTQFLFGPGPVEMAWAKASYRFSIQAIRVYNQYIVGPSDTTYMRAFSFFHSTHSFGFYQVGAFIALLVYRLRNRLSAGMTIFLGALILSGLLASFTRAPWFALLVCLFLSLCAPLYRRLPTLALFAGIIAGFFITTYAAGYAYEHIYPAQRGGIYNDVYIAGAFTAGSLGARTDAIPKLFELAKQFPITGLGTGVSYGISAKVTGSLATPKGRKNPIDERHNYLGGLIWQAGLPALLLFLGFMYLAVAAGRKRLASANPVDRKVAALMLSLVVAVFLAGAFGPTPTSEALFLGWCGIIVAGAAGRKKQERQAPDEGTDSERAN